MNLFNWKLIVVSVLFSGEVLAQEGVVSIQKSLEIYRVLAKTSTKNKTHTTINFK